MTFTKELIVLPESQLRAALEQIRPEFKELTRKELAVLNVDPLAAVATVQGALPGLLLLRPQFESALRDFDFQYLDNLNLYALALIQSHSLYQSASSPPENLPELVAETKQLCSLLLSDVTVLARRGYIKGVRVHELGRFGSYKGIASDILALVAVLRADWNAVSSNCGVTELELNRAEVLGEQLIRLLGFRDRCSMLVANAALERQKVFTLFVRAYDNVRRAVTYVRWHDNDAEKIAPSLYSGKKVNRKKVLNAASEPAASDKSGETTPSSSNGLPGSDPFEN